MSPRTPRSPRSYQPTPVLDGRLAVYSEVCAHVNHAVARLEEAIECLASAQDCLKPGPLQRFLALLEVDLAIDVDNQRVLVEQINLMIDRDATTQQERSE